jgi:hypothetical protein
MLRITFIDVSCERFMICDSVANILESLSSWARRVASLASAEAPVSNQRS